ncbi:MAG: SLBB domain-containing protein [Bacteroidetes bacterium]|nr:SLBB domain-containing protein [Bacteroidota bacterium]
MQKWFSALTVAAALYVSAGANANAQVIDLERSRYSPAAYYNYGEQGDITVIVNVWGTVRNPGLYEVTKGTTLSTLFSLAGGPLVGTRYKSTTRRVTLKLTRGEERIVDFTMENQVLALEMDPVLEMGDVLTVETVERRGFSWRDVFPVVAAVASVALAAERLAGN